jgi:hypothetical protein
MIFQFTLTTIMVKSLSSSFTRRYQILTIFCSLIIATLLTCLDASSWRTIETNDLELLAHFYSPFQHDASRYSSNKENETFTLNVGPLWRCLTTKINGKSMIINTECSTGLYYCFNRNWNIYFLYYHFDLYYWSTLNI